MSRGNGARPPEIIELAMIRVEGGVLSPRTQHWLIRPVQRIAPAVSRIHGISDGGTWRDAPTHGGTWADDIRERLDELAIVGHNVRVEFDILTRTLEDWRPTAAVDTLRLARAILPDPAFAQAARCRRGSRPDRRGPQVGRVRSHTRPCSMPRLPRWPSSNSSAKCPSRIDRSFSGARTSSVSTSPVSYD